MHDENPYRIYRVRGAQGVPELVATTQTKEGLGTALVTLGEEGEFDGHTVGILVREGDEESGKWIVNPWPGRDTPERFMVAVAAGSGKQHLMVSTNNVYERVTLCGRPAMGWGTSDELLVSKPICRVCKSSGEQITRSGHGAVTMPVRSL